MIEKMIKKTVPIIALFLLVFFAFGIPKSNAGMMKNPCGVSAANGMMGQGKSKTMMSKGIMMKMKMWMPEMMSYGNEFTVIRSFSKIYPGAHLFLKNRNILKLTPLQVRQEVMLVKRMENEAIPLFKILNRTKKEFYIEIIKNNPSVSKLESYEKTFGKMTTLLAEDMISTHIKATHVLTPVQKTILRKMLIIWPTVNVVYP